MSREFNPTIRGKNPDGNQRLRSSARFRDEYERLPWQRAAG